MGDMAVEAVSSHNSAPAPTQAEPSGTLEARLYKRLAASRSHEFVLNVEFTAAPGITIVFGPSGSGKTTLLECIAGLQEPDEGRVRVGKHLYFDKTTGVNVPTDRRSLGYVFQGLALFPHMSVEENVQYGLMRLSSAAKRQRTSEILAALRIEHLRRRLPEQISGGEGQRVALARALVVNPCLLLLDEPLAALDAPTKSAIIGDLRTWNQQQRIPILYVTHSRVEVDALGERVLVMEHGKVLAEGTPHGVLEAPRQEAVAQSAGFENIFNARVIAAHVALGTMTCELEGGPVRLETPLARLKTGASVRIAIRAGDILLATMLPHGLSARNIIRGKLVSLEQRDFTVLAHVDCEPDCGTHFQAHLTPGARDSLQLQPGREVWLVIKTHSCHMLYD
jgi:molybdate transport system ATP-binding protein